MSFKSVSTDRNSVAAVQADARDWHQARVRVDRGGAAVFLDGQLVNAGEELDEFTGYLTFFTTSGAWEIRAFTVSEELSSQTEPFGAGAYRISEPGLERPRALRDSKPYYPHEPYALGIQGAVRLDVVIREDGSPGDVRVTKSVHPDLDQEAIASARKWRFSPARKDGAPVPVIVAMEVSFKLADRPPQ